jgi:AcrR family transcriptional regulator
MRPLSPTEPRPLRRDAERNRLRILEAAREVFSERGLSGSYDEIAQVAGVGVGTVYRRFPDREELIDALFESRVAEVAGLARAAAESPDPWQGLVDYLAGSLQMQSEDRGLSEIMHGGDREAERFASARELIVPLLERLVARAHEAGVLRPDVELGDLALLQLAAGAIADAGRDVAPDVWRRLTALALDGMRGDGVRSELAVPALEVEEFAELMAQAKAGHRRQPRPETTTAAPRP